MGSKLEAARRATVSGADVVVADARRPGVVDSILAGDDVGTLFVGSKSRLPAKKSWIAFTLRPRGALVLDAGAARAVGALGKSVLPVGVLGVRGDFQAGDAVRILGPDGAEIGRGLVRCSAADAARVAGGVARELGEEEGRAVLVHRDDLVVGVM
jgi:glutamate 5-kinase